MRQIRNNWKILTIGISFILLDLFLSLWFILDWRPKFMKQSPYRIFIENSLAEGKYSGPKGETFINGVVLNIIGDTIEIELSDKRRYIHKVLPTAKFVLVSGESKPLELTGNKLSLVKKGNIVWIKVDLNNIIDQITFFQL